MPIDGAFPPLGDISELPFRVADHTGLMRGVSVVDPGDVDETVSQVPGRDDAIYVTWLGGMCDRRVLVDFDGTVNGYAVNIKTERNFGGCVLAGIRRKLMFEFTEPVDASAVSVSATD